MKLTLIICILALCGCSQPELPQMKELRALENKFTSLNEGHCSYWNQDIEPSEYIKISCWEWLDIVMDNPNESTECILRECKRCSRHIPNVIRYEGEWIVGYGWTGYAVTIGAHDPSDDAVEKCGGY